MNGAYLHLLLNHLPVIGTIFGLLLLLFALLRKSEEVKRVALSVFVLTALAAVPTYLTGEPAEEVAEHLPGVAKALIEQHESAALLALSAALATGVVALAGLFLAWRSKQLPRWQLGAGDVVSGVGDRRANGSHSQYRRADSAYRNSRWFQSFSTNH